MDGFSGGVIIGGIIGLFVGGVLGIATICLCSAGRQSGGSGMGYCRSCGHAPGFEATATCYECTDYDQWTPRKRKCANEDR